MESGNTVKWKYKIFRAATFSAIGTFDYVYAEAFEYPGEAILRIKELLSIPLEAARLTHTIDTWRLENGEVLA
jgi:hypothetical protein